MRYDFEDLVTGTITYKGVEFTFVFNREELRLIPPIEKADEVGMWFRKEIQPGMYTMGDPVYVEEDFLTGKCNEGHDIILFPVKGRTIGRINDVLIVGIFAYVWKRIGCSTINRIGFKSPEIDCIHPVKDAIASTQWSETGEYKVETRPFSETTTEKQKFKVDGKDVMVNFGISMSAGGDFTKPPLSLQSEMYFEFEETNDYAFVFKLYRIANVFVQYLCYRKNVPFSEINLAAPFKDGTHMQFARLYILDDQAETEMGCLKERRFIKQEYISGYEGEILSDIALGLLYTRNIPQTYRQGRTIDAARFVMITAAFEWEFRRLYPDGIKKRQQTIDAENTAEAALKLLYDDAKGKLKNIYKTLINNIKFAQFSSRINHTGKSIGEIVDIFGNRLYRLNGQKLKYSDMGERLGKQRNNYAHGNLDQEFVGLSLLDLIYLEMVVYAMQLKFYGLTNTSIQRAINDLFHQSIVIKEDDKNQL